MPERTEPVWRSPTFQQFVADCASNPHIVKKFNELHGLKLPCPVPGLIDPATMLENKTEQEMLNIALFIFWVQQNVLQHVAPADANLAKLKRFYGEKLDHSAARRQRDN